MSEENVERATLEIESLIKNEATRPRFLRQIEAIPLKEPAPVPEPTPKPPKIDHTYLPLDALEEVSRSLMYGAAKREAWNWAVNPISWTERLAKAQRHIFEFQKGINIDPSSGEAQLQHLACAITQLMFLQSYVINDAGTDDRFKR
jgi:Domain of unknown function (DUF5664)